MRKLDFKNSIKINASMLLSVIAFLLSALFLLSFIILYVPGVEMEAVAAYASNGKKVYPAGGATYVSSDFQTPSRPTHNGIDILRGDGKIYAVDAGTVVLAEEGCTHDSPYMSCECNGGCGNHVEILHEDGYRTKYLHLKDSILVKTGDKVTKGQHIGMMGSTGRSSAVHLHFTVVNPAGAYVSPNDYLGGEFAELPPQNVKVRLSKDILHPYQPMIVTYTASKADFYMLYFYDDEGNLLKTLNSQDEVSKKSMTVSFGVPGKYSLRVDAYNETGKAHSDKMSFQVFDGAIDLVETSSEMLKKVKKTNRGKKRSPKVKMYDLHIIEKAVIVKETKPEVYTTPSLPPEKEQDKAKQDKKEQETEPDTEVVQVSADMDNSVSKSKQKKTYKKKGFEYKVIKKGTAVKITRCLNKSKTIIIPEKIVGLPVKVIGREAFVDEKGVCQSKNKIVLSKNIEKLQKGIKIPAAKTYKVNKRNLHFSSENGVLYNEKKTTVLRYPVLNVKSDKKRIKKNVYQIREGVKKIGREAFKGATFAGYVFPNSLKKISVRAFENNAKLTKVKVPKSVNFVGVDTFAGSYELKRVDLYSKKMPTIRLNSAAFASAKVFVPEGSALKRYNDLASGGYTVNERKK